MCKGGRYLNSHAPKAGGRKKKILLVVLILIVAILATAIGGGLGYYNYVLSLVGEAEYVEKNPSREELAAILGEGYLDAELENATEGETQPTVSVPETTGEIINVMLVGQQSRDGETAKLADTMILATLNLKTKTLTLTSFQRDMYIKLPDYAGKTCGKNRINTCYALGYAWGDTKGAMEMLDLLLLEQFGVDVDYNVEVDFVAFQEVINALGGVDVELTEAEATHLNKNTDLNGAYKKGTNHLDGAAALAYARTRSAFAGDNDFNRTDRQRKMISSILEKCRTMSLTQLNNMLTTILPLVKTDMSSDVITKFALELLPILPELSIVSNQCPAEGTYSGQMVEIYGVNSGVLVPDVEKNRELLMAIAETDVIEPTETTVPAE
ncbi:MAG: LCP family protein [Oscillospiraceae bacterium]|nr:LCP family protein [Oscillospiraceae bacterium]